MTLTVVTGEALRFAGRDILCIVTDRQRQGFYRSSGKNSGMEGQWLPFDGITFSWGGLWFAKDRFLTKDKLHRFGTYHNKMISEDLARATFREGKVSDPFRINLFLNTKYSLSYNSLHFDAFKAGMESGEFDRYLI